MRPISFPSLLCCAALIGSVTSSAQTPTTNSSLRSPSDFASISDSGERSRAIFAEAAKVLTHPRCMNCHPAGDSPLQANDQHVHMPPILRGENGLGVAGVACSACHTEKNFTLVGTGASYKSIPGHPRWQLAPIEMAWEGKTLTQICQQIKDPARNGGRSLADLIHHIGEDTLVGWAWAPGFGREPAPGTQKQAGALVEAWANSGAACPD